ncbi:MAG TPA: site-specific integrase [Luteibacter sp.]|jgi:integrase|uniref:site-specific integrase n=1 Tax=Luteibacter sp. TaxID=1886636 RepID=UPI002F41E4F7
MPSVGSSASARPPLYDLHAGPDGVIHFAPHSEEGHRLGMAFIERMWQLDDERDARAVGPAPSTEPAIAVAVHPRPVVTTRVGASIWPRHRKTMDRKAVVVPAPSAPPPMGGGKLLSELCALHLANVRNGEKRATPAVRDRQYALDLLLDVVGDRPIGTLGSQDAIDFVEVLASWPRNKQHLPQFEGLSARQTAKLAKKGQVQCIEAGTQHKHLMHVNALMNWVIKCGDLTSNPFRYLDTQRYRRDETGRVRKKKDRFSHADLRVIFDPVALRDHSTPYKYWVPLICYFTGMRVNEASQLTLGDVHRKHYLDDEGREHQVLVFDIGRHNVGQSVKSNYSIRDVPVPQALLDLGFERYIDDVRASNAEDLFPGLNRHQEGGAGKTVSHWFNATHLRDTCGISSKRKTMHCFRHNLITLMERCNVADSIVHAVHGHAPGEGIDRRHYIADGTVLECQAVLDGLPFPNIPMTPYVSGRFDDYLTHQAAEREREARAREQGAVFVKKKGPRLWCPPAPKAAPV